MMSREGKFLIYCVETYKVAKNLTGKQVAELFTRYRVWEYVYSCFEALHTTGAKTAIYGMIHSCGLNFSAQKYA